MGNYHMWFYQWAYTGRNIHTSSKNYEESGYGLDLDYSPPTLTSAATGER